jgi:hypothetical protein
MNRCAAFVLSGALLLGMAGSCAAGPLTPLEPGFHQTLQCDHGTMSVDVAAGTPAMGRAVRVTTALTFAGSTVKTTALREVDGAGNIYALGYVLAQGVIKRFPRRLLLPANPPKPGEVNSYFNVTGVTIQKRYEGRHAGGYVFSDFIGNHKLNAATYVPSVGITEARFFGLLANNGDLICR